ncbi:DUF116 domain-containing protein [Devosia chinhatensis]|nr:DUF116 domain-containing protein [Devosia chinhatensis]
MTPIERAFELARSGKCRTLTEIKSALKSEGYELATVTGGTLAKQLRGLMVAHAEIK